MMQPNEETSNTHCVSVRYEFCTISCFLLPYFRIKSRQFGHLDECPKPLFLNDVVRDGELVVGRLFGKDRHPCVKAVDTLLLQSLRAEILKELLLSGKTFWGLPVLDKIDSNLLFVRIICYYRSFLTKISAFYNAYNLKLKTKPLDE